MAEASEEKPARNERNSADDAQRRGAGAAFDERMKEFASDPPQRAGRSDQDRRRKR